MLFRLAKAVHPTMDPRGLQVEKENGVDSGKLSCEDCTDSQGLSHCEDSGLRSVRLFTPFAHLSAITF